MDEDLCLSVSDNGAEPEANSVSVTLSLKGEGKYRYCMKMDASAQTDQPPKQRRKRQHSIGTKVERCDKYWFRAFRAFVQRRDLEEVVAEHPKDRWFWEWYYSREGKPESSSEFVSYNRAYREHLLACNSFREMFHSWIVDKGIAELTQKYGETHFGKILRNYGDRLLAADSPQGHIH